LSLLLLLLHYVTYAVGLSNIIVGLSGSGYTGTYIFSLFQPATHQHMRNIDVAAAAAAAHYAVGLSNIIVGLSGSGYTGSYMLLPTNY
jgi:hypothetical protein